LSLRHEPFSTNLASRCSYNAQSPQRFIEIERRRWAEAGVTGVVGNIGETLPSLVPYHVRLGTMGHAHSQVSDRLLPAKRADPVSLLRDGIFQCALQPHPQSWSAIQNSLDHGALPLAFVTQISVGPTGAELVVSPLWPSRHSP
jgi:hypothetical protein